jgi:hypothetical protein
MKKAYLSKFIKWLSKPFSKNIRFMTLAKYFVIIFIAGILLRNISLLLFPSSGELEQQFLKDFCTPTTLLIVVLAPLTENFLFMILPFMWKKKKGLAVGLAIWILFHYLDRDLPSLAQNLAMAVFFFKSVSAKKYKESIFFHGIINWFAALSCI